MKRLFLGVLFTLALVILAWAGGLTLFPSAPVLTITDNAAGLAWGGKYRRDLAGYLLAYAVNDADYMEECLIDLGNVLTYDFEALPADVVRTVTKLILFYMLMIRRRSGARPVMKLAISFYSTPHQARRLVYRKLIKYPGD